MEPIQTRAHNPRRLLVALENSENINFSAKDIILAMIGEGYEDISRLLKNLENIGANNVFIISEEILKEILEEMETEGLIVAIWDTERVARNYLG